MTRDHLFQQPNISRRSGIFLLTAMLFLGCIVGIWLSGDAQEQFADALQALSVPPVGFVPLAVLLLPLLLSALAVYVKWPVFLFPLAFWKAFFFAYVFSGFMSVLGGAGWLICSLGLFSGIFSLPVFCWYWLQHLDGTGFCLRTFLPALAAAAAIGLLDLRVISSFLARILIS